MILVCTRTKLNLNMNVEIKGVCYRVAVDLRGHHRKMYCFLLQATVYTDNSMYRATEDKYIQFTLSAKLSKNAATQHLVPNSVHNPATKQNKAFGFYRSRQRICSYLLI